MKIPSAPNPGRQKVFLSLFVVYVGFYFCRVTVPVALPLLQQRFGYTATEVGLILSSYYTLYALSKFANGFLADWIGGKRLLSIGLSGTILCNIGFGMSDQLAAQSTWWALNAFFQATGWLAIIPIMSHWYRPDEQGRAMGFMSLSYQLGDFVSRGSAGLILASFGLLSLFVGHALVLFGVGILCLLLLPAQQPERPRPGRYSGVDDGGPDQLSRGSERRAHLREMLSNGLFWVTCGVYLLVSVVRYVFWGWSVSYLMETGSSIGQAALLSALFPLAGSAGTVTAGWLSDRLGRGPVMVVMLSLLGAVVMIFSQLASGPTLWLSLYAIGFFLYGPYSMMAGAMAIDFGKRHSSGAAAGLIDGVGAVGTVVTGVGMGYLVDTLGWTAAFTGLTGLVGVSAVLSILLWRHEIDDS